jgi:hypothetical protein
LFVILAENHSADCSLAQKAGTAVPFLDLYRIIQDNEKQAAVQTDAVRAIASDGPVSNAPEAASSEFTPLLM